jgi:lysyl-tRNA synthetase class 2
MTQRGDRLLRDRQAKLERLRQRQIDPYPARFSRTHTAIEAQQAFLAAEDAGKDGPMVAVAGRISLLRGMGKTSFVDVQDGTGQIQFFCRQSDLGDGYALLQDLDLGDIIGAHGTLMRTRAGEVSVAATELRVLAKALRPPPEKFHGLQDQEKRYRQRYLDLIANPEVHTVARQRAQIIAAMRRFLDGRGFLEVETPVLVPVPAGAMAQPFVTQHHALDRQLFLRIATELYLKKLIVGGMDKVYEIGRVFRNEGVDADHNPEFTLLESYEAYTDYQHVMTMVEEMVSTVAEQAIGSTTITYEGHEINLKPPWPRFSLHEAIEQHSGIDINHYPDARSLADRMRAEGITVTYAESRGRLVDKLVSATVEPALVQPTFLVDYPVEMSPLAKARMDNPNYAERFEAFAAGMELANAFTELNDPAVQRQRMEEQELLRKQYQGEELDRIDEDFLVALEHGMPPTGGLGIGVDRLVMLLTGQRNIRDVVLFPQVRSVE